MLTSATCLLQCDATNFIATLRVPVGIAGADNFAVVAERGSPGYRDEISLPDGS